MENRAHAFAVGVFLVLFAAALAGLYWWFSGAREQTRDYTLVTRNSVTGLNQQAIVRYRGIRVGKVQEIALDPADTRDILVHIRIDATIPINRATRARITAQGVTGLAFIQLEDDGSGAPLSAAEAAQLRLPLEPGLVSEATEATRELLGRARDIGARLDDLLSAERLDRLEQGLDNLARTSGHLERTLAQAPELAADLRRFTSVENARRLEAALANLESASRALPGAVEQTRATLASLASAAARADTLGAQLQHSVGDDTLPRVHDLLTDLQASTAQARILLEDIQRSPQMLLLGRETQSLGPGEVAR